MRKKTKIIFKNKTLKRKLRKKNSKTYLKKK